jgi:hypothetical protein
MSVRSKLRLYHNPRTNFLYKYPRPYSTKLDGEGVAKSVTSDGISYKNVYTVGIPDGVSPLTNIKLIQDDVPRRLVVFSDSPLNENELEVVDDMYKFESYPILYLNVSVNDTRHRFYDIPSINFITTNDNDIDGYGSSNSGTPSTLSRYVEYRYMDKRHQPANILFDTFNGNVFRFVPPVRPKLVIVMPANFIRTGTYTGYFLYGDNLIIRVYSKQYVLSSANDGPDPGVYSSISTDNAKQMATFRSILAKLGMHRISSLNSDQIYAHDAYMTIVIGNIANINLPLYE